MRAKVFERFFRLPGQDQAGSGLGVAIAERAAAHNRASIRLDDGPGGRGLLVTVAFQATRQESTPTEAVREPAPRRTDP
jgi:two-component system sensor histidine kinase QseC